MAHVTTAFPLSGSDAEEWMKWAQYKFVQLRNNFVNKFV